MHRQSAMCRPCYTRAHERPDSYVTKECPICGESFAVHKAHIARGQGRYCSRVCARSGNPTRKRTRRAVQCHVCGKRFERHLSEMRKAVGEHHFCSPECWYKHNHGENHYLWAGGQHERMNSMATVWRNEVLARDHGYCRICHTQDRLEVHHIRRFATYPDVRWDADNGVTLCHDCHVRFRNREDKHIDFLAFVASVPVMVWDV